MIKHIDIAGNHYEMGYQHGRQVSDLRSQILLAIDNRLNVLQKVEIDKKSYATELYNLWENSAQTTIGMLRGMADALDLEWERFFFYTIATYLLDCALYPISIDQGCTVWAAAYPTMRSGVPILVKNRDYWPDHRELQCLVKAQPNRGYKYKYLTSVASPGVFSSGMNEVGLAVADTHVVSRSIGPGLARYTVMMDLLEHHRSVPSALEYLQSIQHMGNGTIVLLDTQGEMAVYETGYKTSGTVFPENGYVVSTNHFITAELAHYWVPRGPEEIHGNSQKRYARVTQALQDARGLVDISWAKALMSSHGDPLEAICRHQWVGPRSVTISSIILLPQGNLLYLAVGSPCENQYNMWLLNDN